MPRTALPAVRGSFTVLGRSLPAAYSLHHGVSRLVLVTRVQRLASSRISAGFTMVELSVVLVIIAVILSAVSVGSDVLRSARGQRIFSEFVTGWHDSFLRYTALTNVVPGDNVQSPSYIIKTPVGGLLLCNTPTAPDLTNIFLAHGIALPAGWGPGAEDRYVYQDSNGSPHELRVCLLTADWAAPGTSAGVYVLAKHQVMQLTGLTIELAIQLDTLIDGRPDQRFGHFRSIANAADTSTSSNAGVDWPRVKSNVGENNIGEVPAYLDLSP